ncbi:hypothetical protein L1987_82085 [Smallanthus sonchifolius]|uniref:Uncharacterized protein n=1 Tax=Smallanthus sonchifolius TaxID=185202 RepID=A0ACB8YSV1_9ASTR|nr:hypothetical protein L1987_82085 [Smallanthus sonchifolius]
MSGNIPFEIQVEIIKRTLVKSLIRFRSVSKQWKSVIDSSEFIRDHSVNQTQPHHLLFALKLVTLTSMKAEVFALSSRAWRSVSMSLPYNSIEFSFDQLLINGIIYWVAFVKLTKNDESLRLIRVISFDLTSEEFGEVVLPARKVHLRDSLTRPSLSISKLKESLVVLNYYAGDAVCDVWVMLKNVFTKLSTVKVNESDGSVFYNMTGFRKNGLPTMEQIYRRDGFLETEVRSNHIIDLGICGSVIILHGITTSA